MTLHSPISVSVHAADLILQEGTVASINNSTGMSLSDHSDASVSVLVGDSIDDDVFESIRAMHALGSKVVLVMSSLNNAKLMAGMAAGASSFIYRRDATPEQIESIVRATASGASWLPSTLMNQLLDSTNSREHFLAPGTSCETPATGFTDREIEILRLAAEGLETAQIASKLSYSERTVKSEISAVTSRYGLRNRTHAVAFAIRQGVI